MTQIPRGQLAVAAVIVVALAWMASRALTPDPAAGGDGAASAVAARGEPGSRDRTTGSASRAADEVVVRAPAERVVVHVAGAVRRPGVYRLTAGQRIADALRRAGGGTRRADLNAINLAAKARDGVQILVPRKAPGGGSGVAPVGAPPAGAGGTAAAGAGVPAGGVIDLNTATAEQLETLDGVGPATSAKILQYRAANGPFRSVDDLDLISGIGPKKLAAIRPRVRV